MSLVKFIKKDGIIFAAGVLCGIFIKTAFAQKVNTTDPISSFADSFPSGEEVRALIEYHINKIKTAIENGDIMPKLPEKIEGVVVPPECFMTVPQMIRDLGYPCEEHEVETADGYILGLHRIPHGIETEQNNNQQKPVIFLQHGLLADSASWTVNGANRSLAFILADNGFDVWLGNVRGNTYSRKHAKLDPNKDKQFWEFSWQEISQFDIPAAVNYTLATSKQKQLYYVGHSQGTLVMFAQLADNPDFNKKIKLFFALGPVFNVRFINSPVKNLVPLHGALHIGQKLLGLGELLPNSEIGKWISTKMHSIVSSHKELSYHGENFMFFLSGFRPWRYWSDRIAVFLAHTPAGTSTQNIIHFAQMIQKEKTLKFDFGTPEQNKNAYDNDQPPGFDLSKITTPIALFWGSEDNLADPDDILSIIPELKTIVRAKQLKDWDHLEYIWGKYAIDELYLEIIQMVQNDVNKLNKDEKEEL